MFQLKKNTLSFRAAALLTAWFFFLNVIVVPSSVYAQGALNLPLPGTMVTLSPAFSPPIIRGLTIYPDNPLRFDFIVDTGDNNLQGEEFEAETTKLIKYFLASLTVPDDEFWVNLSPYEKDRIIPEGLGATELGRDLLAQDYLLKQITASLMYPEERIGSEFWKRVYEKAKQLYGTSEIPLNTFNKVWIVPDRAVVYELNGSAFVGERHLKVMLEEDYIALESNIENKEIGTDQIPQDKVQSVSSVTSDVVREVLIPELEKEVNEGAHFANLRQIFNSMILATWYKKNLRQSLLGQVYMDQNKVKGVDLEDKTIKQQIYDQYLEAFKKGAYNYIKEDYDPATQEMIPRKYFSGGIAKGMKAIVPNLDVRQLDRESPDASRIVGPESQSPQVRIERVTTDLLENTNADQLRLARAIPPQTSSPISPEEFSDGAMMSEESSDGAPQVAKSQRRIKIDQRSMWSTRFYDLYAEYGRKPTKKLEDAMVAALEEHNRLSEELGWYTWRMDVTFPGGLLFRQEKSDTESIVEGVRLWQSRFRPGHRIQPVLAETLKFLEEMKFQDALESMERALDIALLDYNIFGAHQYAVDFMNSMHRPILKSRFDKVSLLGQMILGELVKEGILEEISSTQVRLGLRKDFMQNKDMIMKIAGSHFEEIWEILESSVMTPQKMKQMYLEGRQDEFYQFDLEFEKEEEKLSDAYAPFKGLEEIQRDIRKVLADVSPERSYSSISEREVLEEAQDIVRRYDGDDRYNPDTIDELAWMIRGDYGRRGFRMTLPLWQYIDRVMSKLELVGPPRSYENQVGRCPRLTSEAKAELRNLQSGKLDAMIAQVEKGDVPVVTYKDEKAKMVEEAQREIAIILGLSDDQFTDRQIDDHLQNQIPVRKDITNLETIYDIARLALADKPFYGEKSVLMRRLKYLYSDRTAEALAAMVILDASRMKMNPEGVIFTFSFSELFLGDNPDSGSADTGEEFSKGQSESARTTPPQTSSPIPPEESSDGAMMSEESSDGALQDAKLQEKIKSDQRKKWRTRYFDLRKEYGRKPTKELEDAMLAAMGEYNQLSEELDLDMIRVDVDFPGGLLFRQKKSDPESIVESIRLWQSRFRPGHRIQPVLAETLKFLEEMKFQDALESMERALDIATLDYNIFGLSQFVVDYTNLEHRPILKSSFDKVSLLGQMILGELVKEGILKEISSTQVRLGLGKDLMQNKDMIMKIAGSHFEEIWEILESSVMTTQKMKQMYLEGRKDEFYQFGLEFEKEEEKLGDYYAPVKGLAEIKKDIRSVLADVSPGRPYPSISEREVLEEAQDIARNYDEDDRYNPNTIDELAWEVRAGYGRRGFRMTLPLWQHIDRVMSKLELVGPPRTFARWVGRRPRLTSEAKAELERLQSGKLDAVIAQVEKGDVPVVTYKDEKAKMVEEAQREIAIILGLSDGQFTDRQIDDHLQKQIPVRKDITSLETIYDIARLALAGRLFYGEKSALIRRLKYLYSDKTAEALAAMVMLDAFRMKMNPEAVIFTFSFSDLFLGDNPDSGSADTGEESSDGAMMSEEEPAEEVRPAGESKDLGGINFNPAMLDLQIKRDGNGVPLPATQQPIQDLRIDGFLPVIINVAPVTVPALLSEDNNGRPAVPQLSLIQ
ncbi:MAG: hypothetical protein WC552_01520 [Candidatus Omnitrophota bacterium]